MTSDAVYPALMSGADLFALICRRTEWLLRFGGVADPEAARWRATADVEEVMRMVRSVPTVNQMIRQRLFPIQEAAA